ncbi:hypothetical protein [Streptomyces goshikiensis]|uniref:hypothetical protein n=1 Tax=Streptomyces goshikiensis TaxID=1942 RepID=UPI00365B3629
MELVSAGAEVTARWRSDPEEAFALMHELAADGELAVDEILDEAVDAAVLTGLLALQGPAPRQIRARRPSNLGQ